MENELRKVVANELIDPTTGEIVDLADVDQMIDAWERLRKHDAEIYAAKATLARALAALTVGDTKARRVQGHRRKAVVEMPGASWDKPLLKEAWNAYPQFRDTYLRIETIAPQLREIKKIRSTSGPKDFETFKKIVLAAERPATANPSIKVEV